jgi:predicted anti-sigma-YlaC factor YlaD
MHARHIALALLCSIAMTGCASLQQVAVNKAADALAGSGSGFGSDDDPELIADAAPFSLKLMEILLAQAPKHTGLLTAAARGFTQYSWAFVQQDADQIEGESLDAAFVGRVRARNLYWRARDYGLRALESRHAGFTAVLHDRPAAAAAMLDRHDAEAIYWTVAAMAASIAIDKDSADALATLPRVDALQLRLAALDPDYGQGALDNFLISWGMGLPGARDPQEQATRHFERAVRLSEGRKAAPYVAFAETVCVARQDRGAFVAKLEQALAIDVAASPAWRLENRVMQDRARWLLSRADELFIE